MSRSYQRAKQTITYEKLREIAKNTLGEPNPVHYLHEDVKFVVEKHISFLVAIGPETDRLNAMSMALVARDVWKLSKGESKHFGQALAGAFSHCRTAGDKASSGAKLAPGIMAVHKAWATQKGPEAKAESAKAEPSSPAKRPLKSEASSPATKRPTLAKCLSSPSQIAALYSGKAAVVKEEKKVAQSSSYR